MKEDYSNCLALLAQKRFVVIDVTNCENDSNNVHAEFRVTKGSFKPCENGSFTLTDVLRPFNIRTDTVGVGNAN